MRQCILSQNSRQQTAWIDVEQSDAGRYVDLKVDDGIDTWRIDFVSEVCFTKDWINARSRDHKNMKKMTDV